MEHLISINKQKCIGCSNCIKDCPMYNIELIDKKAFILSQNCMKCGHCVAVCPVGAVEISGYSELPIDIETQPKVESKDLYNAIKYRRSIRQFKTNKIDRKIIENIIETGRYTPTARNKQGVKYIVLEEKIRYAEDLAIGKFKKMQKILGFFSKKIKGINIDDNFFFKNAPIAILILSKNKIDGALASSNMALMAESYGLGVLYSGFFALVSNRSKKMRDFLEIEKNMVVTTLVLGYPDVKYYRNAQKDDVDIKYI